MAVMAVFAGHARQDLPAPDTALALVRSVTEAHSLSHCRSTRLP